VQLTRTSLNETFDAASLPSSLTSEPWANGHSGLTTGTYTIHVKATDAAGNAGTGTRDFTVDLDAFLTKSVRASRKGGVKLPVRCPGGEVRCVVTVVLKQGRKTVGSRGMTVLGGKDGSAKVRLAKAAKRRLGRRQAQAEGRDDDLRSESQVVAGRPVSTAAACSASPVVRPATKPSSARRMSRPVPGILGSKDEVQRIAVPVEVGSSSTSPR
jgi:hypothetical protein